MIFSFAPGTIMKATFRPTLAIMASAALVAACNTAPQEPAAASAFTYACESGQTVTAAYPTTDTATVQYQGRTYDMIIAISGSGARYVGGGLEWWTKGSGPGSEGTMLRHLANGTSGEILEFCTAS